MNNLKTLIESFSDVKYKRVTRGDDSHAVTLALAQTELEHYVSVYSTKTDLQELRLIRDAIDHWIRRYHGYCIQGGIGSHYIEEGVDPKSSIFEHVVPASKVRDMLIANVLTINQTLNMPTCVISTTSDGVLRKSGLVSSSPDYWLFFKRYMSIGTVIKTHDGKKTVNFDTWTLQKHFDYFKIV
jgi:hypothetical protein